jgi:hypothetical protein
MNHVCGGYEDPMRIYKEGSAKQMRELHPVAFFQEPQDWCYIAFYNPQFDLLCDLR